VKYQVKLKSTVTAWVDVEIDDSLWEGETEQEKREWAADDAVTLSGGFQARLAAAGLEFGPIELAHEELDEIVREPATDHHARLAAGTEWVCRGCGYHNNGGICTHCGRLAAGTEEG
jgi:hypothetical protein